MHSFLQTRVAPRTRVDNYANAWLPRTIHQVMIPATESEMATFRSEQDNWPPAPRLDSYTRAFARGFDSFV
jgi:hypothetical protein